MRLHELQLHNFCNHAVTRIPLEAGMTAFLGRNGSGKSSLFDAIRFALTGNISRPGNKALNIYDLSEANAPSNVKLLFSHNNTQVEVQRNLRPARPTAKLTINGSQSFEGDVQVTEQICSLLGVSTDILNDVIVVAQTDMFAFLDQTESQRAAYYQKLFGTTSAIAVHQALTAELNSIEIPTTGADPAVLTLQLQTATQQVTEAQQVLEAIPAFATIEEAMQGNRQILQVHQQRQDLLQQLHVAETAVQQHVTSLQTQQQQIDALQAEVDTQTTLVTEAKNTAADAEKTLTHFKLLQQAHAGYERLRQQVTTNGQQLEQVQFTLTAPVHTDLAALQTQQQELERLQYDYSKLLQLTASGNTECPTCGTAVTAAELQSRIAEAREQQPIVEQKLQTVKTAIEQVQTYHQAASDYQRDKANAEYAYELAKQQLEAAERPEPLPAVDVQQLSQLVQNATNLELELTLQQSKVHGLSLQHSNTLGQLQAQQQSVNNYQQRLAITPIYTGEEVAAANEHLQQWKLVSDDRRIREQQLAVLQNTVTSLQQQIQQAEETLRLARVTRAWQSRVADYRGIFDKNGAPKLVSRHNLQKLEDAVNSTLQAFDATFHIRTLEDLSFQAILPGGSRQTATRLSEGQKAVLAMAVRVAINSMFARGIDLLCLDEPTAYMDRDHVLAMEPVLGRLAALADTTGLQCIIITHHVELAHLFDQTVRL